MNQVMQLENEDREFKERLSEVVILKLRSEELDQTFEGSWESHQMERQVQGNEQDVSLAYSRGKKAGVIGAMGYGYEVRFRTI